MAGKKKLSCKIKCLLAMAAGAILGLVGERILPRLWDAIMREFKLGKYAAQTAGGKLHALLSKIFGQAALASSPVLAWFSNPAHFALIYLILNLISFLLFWSDKRRAQNKKWRIPELVLMISSVFGIFGGIFGMYFLRHKTKKPKFYIGLPLIFVIELLLVVLLLRAL